MKFMVISNPRPDHPKNIRSNQTEFWDWFNGQKKKGIVETMYVKAGRGAIIVFNVDSHEMLHRLITEWSNTIAAQFDIYPLIEDPSHQETIARNNATS